MLRKIFLMLTIAASLMLVAGCGNKDQDPAKPDETQQASAKTPPVIASGGKVQDNTNAKQLELSEMADKANITLSFVLGSSSSGVDEASCEAVPKYKAYVTSQPTRLVLEFDSLDYWEYDRSLNIEEDSVINEIFKQFQTNSEVFRIVFQLKDNVEAKVSDKKNQIFIELTKKPQDIQKNYYVLANALTEFREGKVSYNDGFLPVLCEDQESIVLISDPFKEEEEAKAFKEAASLIIDSSNLFVVALSGNDQPGNPAVGDFATVYSQSVIKRNGKTETLPVVVPDGLYLCSTADGSKTLFNKITSEADADFETMMLWVLDSKGKFKPLTDIEFASIEKADFSPDGKKLAMLERAGETTSLYIFDMETNQLSNLGEEGLGTMTSNFIWDMLGTAIYAISGNDAQQLLKYDFTIPDTTARISAVEEQELNDGDLGSYNGELYFTAVTNEEDEQVFKIKPEGGLRQAFAKGGSFQISPNGEHMAILSSDYSDDVGEGANVTVLTIKDMVSGEEKVVVNGGYVVSYGWTPDCQLFYTIANNEELNEQYSFDLTFIDAHSGETKIVASLMNSEFYTTYDSNLIYLPYIVDEGTRIRATYKLQLD